MVSVLLRFCKVPRNDEIALQHFFFFLAAAQEFFFYYIYAACNFFLPTCACRNFFFKINHLLPRPSRVKWSASYCGATRAIASTIYLRLSLQLRFYVPRLRFPVSVIVDDLYFIISWRVSTSLKARQQRQLKKTRIGEISIFKLPH